VSTKNRAPVDTDTGRDGEREATGHLMVFVGRRDQRRAGAVPAVTAVIRGEQSASRNRAPVAMMVPPASHYGADITLPDDHDEGHADPRRGNASDHGRGGGALPQAVTLSVDWE